MTRVIHRLQRGHWPDLAWCYMGLTIAEAGRRGIGGHLFCHGWCERKVRHD